MPVMIVAELGSLWAGNKQTAARLIHESAQAGCNAVKFQWGWSRATQELHGKTYNTIREADQYAEYFAERCAYEGVELLASIFSLEGLETARRIGQKRYKVASQVTYDHPDLVRAILSDKKETFVSHGMLNEGNQWPDYLMNADVRHIWCRSIYPTLETDLRHKMPNHFSPRGAYYGYSDHCFGIESCLLAIARGARFVEVHVTLNPAEQSIRDHAFSKTPEQLAELVRIGRGINRLVEAIE